MDKFQRARTPLHPSAQDILDGVRGFLGQQHPPASLSSHSASGVIQGKAAPCYLVVENHRIFPPTEAPGLGGSTFSIKAIHPPEA